MLSTPNGKTGCTYHPASSAYWADQIHINLHVHPPACHLTCHWLCRIAPILPSVSPQMDMVATQSAICSTTSISSDKMIELDELDLQVYLCMLITIRQCHLLQTLNSARSIDKTTHHRIKSHQSNITSIPSLNCPCEFAPGDEEGVSVVQPAQLEQLWGFLLQLRRTTTLDDK